MQNVHTEPILKVHNLTTKLKIAKEIYAVVENLSFELHLGKTLAIVGESGCGKSMTALSLLRILPQPPTLPPEGEVIYQGKNLLLESENQMRKIRGKKIAMIFQDPSSALNPVYTIGDQLIEACQLHLGLYGNDAEDQAAQALHEVGIPSPRLRMSEFPHQMSGGMKQRVMIAMALIGQPEILIADEPTTALDVTIQAQVLDLIRALQKKRGMALLLITHDMGIVAEIADDVIVMYASQAVEEGSVLDIFDRMSHPYTQGLFNSQAAKATAGSRLQPIMGSVPSLSHYPKGCRFHTRCPFVMPKCTQGKIPYFELNSMDGHKARCLLYDESTYAKEEKE